MHLVLFIIFIELEYIFQIVYFIQNVVDLAGSERAGQTGAQGTLVYKIVNKILTNVILNFIFIIPVSNVLFT